MATERESAGFGGDSVDDLLNSLNEDESEEWSGVGSSGPSGSDSVTEAEPARETEPDPVEKQPSVPESSAVGVKSTEQLQMDSMVDNLVSESMGEDFTATSSGTDFISLVAPGELWGMDKTAKQIRANPRRLAPDLLRLFLAARVPIMLWGPVGARKTRTIESFARLRDVNGNKYQVITVQPSTEDPTIIFGIKYTSLDDEGRTVMKSSVPDMITAIYDYYMETKGGRTILFLDEMTTCTPAQQFAALSPLTHGKFGDFDVSNMITVALAANPPGTVSNVIPLGEQVMNRSGHIEWYGDVDVFIEDWSSGFHGAVENPHPDTEWHIKTLLGNNRDAAFRSERWAPGSLVPQSKLEHTERTTTDYAKLLDLLREVCRANGASTEVRHVYTVEIARAFWGDKWAKRVNAVLSLESKRSGGPEVLARAMDMGLGPDTEIEELQKQFGGVSAQDYDIIHGTMTHLLSELEDKNNSAERRRFAYLAIWAIPVSATTSGPMGGTRENVIQATFLAYRIQKETPFLSADDLFPKFAGEDFINNIKKGIEEVQKEASRRAETRS